MTSRKVRIESKMNGLTITLSEGEYKSKPDSLIVSKFYHGLKQQWVFKKIGDQYCIHSGQTSGVVFDVEGASTSIYSGVLCFKHHGKDNQLWRLKSYKNPKDENDKGSYYIENVRSGLVLEIEGGINHEGMSIVQNKQINGNLNQLWLIKDPEHEKLIIL